MINISELKRQLGNSYDHIDKIQNLYNEELNKNKYPIEQLDSHFKNI
ncbi:17709_t:CDS:2 [Entrophospora sp. SA101]|nr:17709_t:CDS:2 [Entrophospora sp. SA101]